MWYEIEDVVVYHNYRLGDHKKRIEDALFHTLQNTKVWRNLYLGLQLTLSLVTVSVYYFLYTFIVKQVLVFE